MLDEKAFVYTKLDAPRDEHDVAILEPEVRILHQRGRLPGRGLSFSDVLVVGSDDGMATSDKMYFQSTQAKTDASQTYSMCND